MADLICALRLLLAGPLAALCMAGHSLAAVDGVTVTLESGEVVGKSHGLGKATLTARVANASGRTVEGIRIAAWYSLADVLPGADAEWRIHEFVFDPALAPGGSTTLTFSDDNAAQYVLLEARAVKYRAALRYDGALHDLALPVLHRGDAAYIALRDLIDAIGGRVGSREGFIVIERFGNTVRLKAGSPQAQLDGSARTLANPVIEEAGRSYISLSDAASLFNFELADLGSDLWELK